MLRFTIDDVELHRRTAFSFTATDPSNDVVMVDFCAQPARLLGVPTTPLTKTGDTEGEVVDKSIISVDHLLLHAMSASP